MTKRVIDQWIIIKQFGSGDYILFPDGWVCFWDNHPLYTKCYAILKIKQKT